MGFILSLNLAPIHIPINAAMIAIPISGRLALQSFVLVAPSLMVRAIVATVKLIPNACINSFFDNFSDCKYGTSGITNTPVATVTRPDNIPTIPPMNNLLFPKLGNVGLNKP